MLPKIYSKKPATSCIPKPVQPAAAAPGNKSTLTNIGARPASCIAVELATTAIPKATHPTISKTFNIKDRRGMRLTGGPGTRQDCQGRIVSPYPLLPGRAGG